MENLSNNYDTIIVIGGTVSSEFLDRIEDQIKVSLFTDNDLKLIFRDKPVSAIYNSLAYHLKKKNVERYRRGLYSLSRKNKIKNHFSKFKLANKLVLHSFISFESALSYHGLIPEAVYEITSACLVKNKLFKNSLGQFSFTYSPVTPFYLGVEKDKISEAKIANPIRALFDLIYSRRKIYKTIFQLVDDFRIDQVELNKFLKNYKKSEILDFAELYNKKSTKNLAQILIKELG